MKSRELVAGMAALALATLSGCAGGVNAQKSIDYADSNKTIAQEANVDAAQIESANAKLDSAKALQADGEEEAAAALAEESVLNSAQVVGCGNALKALDFHRDDQKLDVAI